MEWQIYPYRLVTHPTEYPIHAAELPALRVAGQARHRDMFGMPVCIAHARSDAPTIGNHLDDRG